MKLKIRLFFGLALVATILGSLWGLASVLAVTDEECARKSGEEKVNCYTELVKETGGKKETLASEIDRFDARIALTVAKISQTNERVRELEKEIEELLGKINQLDTSLDRVSAILANRISATYKKGNIDPFLLFFSSDSFASFLTRYKYLQVVQRHDRKLLLAMEETKNNFETQKSLKEEKQEELEKLQRLLESQKASLAQQKRDKEYLLEVTKQDEKRYQQLLASARAEQAALESVMRQALALLKDGSPIEEGAQVALVGNSGAPYCSTGPHLHFEIRKNDAPQDPASFLKNISVTYDDDDRVGRMNFSGDWNWPIQDPRVTQEYGMSYWARLGWYNGGPHTGIDITSSNNIIKAPKKGTLYKGNTSCRGTGMNFVAIDHGDGLISWYWHVQ